jgi:tetratricopeptide (TPR) repeat protein
MKNIEKKIGHTLAKDQTLGPDYTSHIRRGKPGEWKDVYGGDWLEKETPLLKSLGLEPDEFIFSSDEPAQSIEELEAKLRIMPLEITYLRKVKIPSTELDMKNLTNNIHNKENLQKENSRGVNPTVGISHENRGLRSKSLREIEYAGYLLGEDPCRVAKHPVFAHIQHPPEGYQFIKTDRSQDFAYWEYIKYIINTLLLDRKDFTFLAHKRVLGSLVKDTIKYGGTIKVAQDFFKDRQLPSQTQLPERTKLAFIPTYPYSIGLARWVIEIEDSTTLFFPYLLNGQTASCEASKNKFFPAVKALLESDSCQGIITHVKSTADSLPKLFKSDKIGKKTVHSPLGVKLPELTGKKTTSDNSCINLLFTNSWHQYSEGFYLRGGVDVLEASGVLAERYSHINLILRTQLPELNNKQANLVANHPRIKLIDKFLSNEELHNLMLNTDIYLIPAARIHVMSTLKALSYGIPVIATDGWGFSEYIDDGRNGILIPGRYGVCSWIDEKNGMLREDYSSINHPNGSNPKIVAGIVEAVSNLIENPEKRQQMSHYARLSTETKFTIAQWNETLKVTFDRIFDNEQKELEWQVKQAEIERERKQLIFSLDHPNLSFATNIEAREKVIPYVVASKVKQETIAFYQQAIEQNPNFSWSYQKLGNALQKLGYIDEAIEAYNSALKIKPNSATFYLNLGDALSKKGFLDEAKSHYLSAIRLRPDSMLPRKKLAKLTLKYELKRSLKQITCHASSTLEEIYGPQNLFWGDVMIWHSQSPPQYPEWLEFELPQPQKWHGISIKPQQRHYERAPSTFTMMGSNDKQQWESLLSVSNYKWVSDNWQQWNFESSNEYKYYKMEILANSDNSNWLTVQRLGPIIDNIKSK